MATTLTIRDENLYGKFGDASVFKLDVGAARVTAQELICARVKREVNDFNARQEAGLGACATVSSAGQNVASGWLGASGTPGVSSGFHEDKGKSIAPRLLDWQAQCERALQAFRQQRFVLLVNERQIERLEEVIEVTPTTTVTFLRLVMLVGG